ncbi:hypothetical protein [Kocuria dechangensis]|nr:hypothetical protein [Kocuria dechangensis]
MTSPALPPPRTVPLDGRTFVGVSNAADGPEPGDRPAAAAG